MKHRLTALLLAIMLILSVACGAFAVSYPQQRGNVNDDAAVLSGSTVADIGSLNTKVKNALGLNFVVVTRHFLGGAEAQSYCSGLFRDWNLDSNTILLLLVIGEEKYAVTTGSNVKKYISDEQINSLLSSKLRALYIEKRDYSGAVGNFLLALTAQAAATSGKKIETGGLFGTTAHSAGSSGADAFLGWTGNWAEGFFSNNSYDTTSYGANTSRQAAEDDDGPGFFSVVIWIAVLYFIFKGNRRRRARRHSAAEVVGAAAAGAFAANLFRNIGRRR